MQAIMPGFLDENESPLSFVEKHAPSLTECCCAMMDRAKEHNARDYLDKYSVDFFIEKMSQNTQKFPKKKEEFEVFLKILNQVD